MDPSFLKKNFLADEERYSVKTLRTNMARALGTNAIDADVWAEFSSKEYKALPPVGRITLDVPVFPPGAKAALQAPIRIEFDPPGGGRGYYRTPSLISLWATAPYLHNNSVGDYYVYKRNADGTQRERFWLSTDGTLRRASRKDSWQPVQDPTLIDYEIDVSIEGRLKMFEDGMWKLLTPAQRHHWVKRTWADSTSTLIPDLKSSVRQLVTAVINDLLHQQLSKVLREKNLVELADQVLRDVQAAAEGPLQESLKQADAILAKLRQSAKGEVQKLASDLFDKTFAKLKEKLDPEKKGSSALDQFEPELKAAFTAKMQQLDTELQRAAQLRIPAYLPVNLYANLGPMALAQAAVASARYRDDPRALAEALLRMSDCPDLVEDSGHTYGSDLTDGEKLALIEFLKTF
jgi:hypothetical protein